LSLTESWSIGGPWFLLGYLALLCAAVVVAVVARQLLKAGPRTAPVPPPTPVEVAYLSDVDDAG
jgi:hypothetical protein